MCYYIFKVNNWVCGWGSDIYDLNLSKALVLYQIPGKIMKVKAELSDN